ncbi:hypothetical protein V5P93_000932 [Actinokineospora auranticolor]|uniref:Uncharacterized protein n=1 Tax=Actinokineospora auranticolor TaxID=155976 RepID=A0A2S6GYE4_9PSEU|nr:hypothetical protein [Actinokineospora auranticolor]PPK70190.1 hypothetical protein CLV40_102100 [Actinokineospora auranticolor]
MAGFEEWVDSLWEHSEVGFRVAGAGTRTWLAGVYQGHGEINGRWLLDLVDQRRAEVAALTFPVVDVEFGGTGRIRRDGRDLYAADTLLTAVDREASMVEIAEALQEDVAHHDWVLVPTCPVHQYIGMHPRLYHDQARWHCAVGQHAPRRIGDVP